MQAKSCCLQILHLIDDYLRSYLLKNETLITLYKFDLIFILFTEK